LFAKRWFPDDVIILCVRWYLRFPVSYREMAEIAWELGIVMVLSRWRANNVLCGHCQLKLIVDGDRD
jgi:transposase-like protein